MNLGEAQRAPEIVGYQVKGISGDRLMLELKLSISQHICPRRFRIRIKKWSWFRTNPVGLGYKTPTNQLRDEYHTFRSDSPNYTERFLQQTNRKPQVQ
jgi:hypothetical protein